MKPRGHEQKKWITKAIQKRPFDLDSLVSNFLTIFRRSKKIGLPHVVNIVNNNNNNIYYFSLIEAGQDNQWKKKRLHTKTTEW